MIDLEAKKAFLYQSALLYHAMIEFAPNDVLGRHLAFRIIVNAISFEDLIGLRAHPRMREIRNVLLAQYEPAGFFEDYDPAEEIRDTTTTALVDFMAGQMSPMARAPSLPELADADIASRFRSSVRQAFARYHETHAASALVHDNLLCRPRAHSGRSTPKSIFECLCRYNTAKAAMTLAMHLIDTLRYDQAMAACMLQAKLDIVLHAVTMADCVLKNDRIPHSIEGLRELMNRENLGDVFRFDLLAADPLYRAQYNAARLLSERLIVRMNWAVSLSDLLSCAEALPLEDVYEMIRRVDLAVFVSLE